MSPEPHLAEFVRSFGLQRYVKGDLFPQDESVTKIDLQQIDFPDETFDLAICNHMLEHVENIDAALRESRRVLKPGARLICQTPYSTRLSRTFEEPAPSTEHRLFFYGQEDHVGCSGPTSKTSFGKQDSSAA